MPFSFGFIVYGLLFLLGVILIELLARRHRGHHALSGESIRKLAHVVSAIALATAPVFLTKTELLLACSGAAIFLLIARSLGILASTLTVNRSSRGEIFFPVGIGLCALLFLPVHTLAYVGGVLTLGFADATAALVGKAHGKRKIARTEKTIEGAIGFFSVAWLLQIGIVGFTGVFGIFAAISLALLEVVLPYDSDNLILPTAGAASLLILSAI